MGVEIPDSATTGPPVTVVRTDGLPDQITVFVPASSAMREFTRVRIDIPYFPTTTSNITPRGD